MFWRSHGQPCDPSHVVYEGEVGATGKVLALIVYVWCIGFVGIPAASAERELRSCEQARFWERRSVSSLMPQLATLAGFNPSIESTRMYVFS